MHLSTPLVNHTCLWLEKDREQRMKHLMENWRGYLNEAPELKLFCDMDGVLVDFQAGVLARMNSVFQDLGAKQDELSQLQPDRNNPDYMLFKAAAKTAEELGGWDKEITAKHINRPDDGGHGLKKTRDFMYRLVDNDRKFWATLPWIDGGKELWNYIKDFDVEILSAPMGPESVLGKEDWVARELGPEVKANITDDKSPWGNRDGQQGLLIDDRAKYRDQFEGGGGLSIAHEPGNAGPSIEGLKQHGFVKEGVEDTEEPAV